MAALSVVTQIAKTDADVVPLPDKGHAEDFEQSKTI